MNSYRFPFYRINRSDTMRRVALLAAIMLSGGLLMIPRIPLALIVILIAIHSFGFLSLRVDRRKAVIYTWIILVMVFAFLREQHVDVIANVTRLTNFMVALAILKIYWGDARGRFLDDYKAILMPIAVIGIITTFLAVVAPGLFGLVQVGSQRMFTLAGVFNYSVPLVQTVGPPRPMGFFWEPGVFAAHLNILLFILFVRKERLVLIAVAFGSILLTQSTAGIGVAVLQSIYFIALTLFQRSMKLREAFLLIIALITAPTVFALTSENFYDKFSGGAVGSFSARNFDLAVAVKVIQQHPLIGIGFSEAAYMRFSGDTSLDTAVLSETDQEGRFSTNGVMIVLYSIGIPLGSLFLVSFFRQKIFPHRLCFGGVLLFLLTSSPLAFTPLFCFFAFSGLALRARDEASKAWSYMPADRQYEAHASPFRPFL